MIVNYYFIIDEVHGRPISETITSDAEGLKGKYHPTQLSKQYFYSFIDITLEDLNRNFEENEEAKSLKELIDIPLDTIEEVITDQRPRADSYSDFFLILFKCFSLASIKPIMKLNEHQIGIIVRDNLIFAIHRPMPTISPAEVFKRFNKYPMKISKGGITFFVTSYMDIMIDQIYKIMNVWSSQIDKYEKKMIEKPEKELLYDIFVKSNNLRFQSKISYNNSFSGFSIIFFSYFRLET